MDNFADNKQDRCPLVLVLDTSSSMKTEDRIGQLNDGLKLLATELKQDDLAALRVQLAIITFDDDARVTQGFVDAIDFEPPTLAANGVTKMGKAMDLALMLVEQQKQAIRDRNLNYFRPWIWLMSDGAPTDDHGPAAARVRQAVQDNKAVVYAVGIGEGANLDVLGEFSSNAEPLRLQSGKFAEMFKWLSKSVTTVAAKAKSSSTDQATITTPAGEQIALDTPRGWAAL